MKNQNGVTLVSLTIYVIVASIVIMIISFLNVNFFNRMTELTNQTTVSNQYSKFCSSFIRDVKGSASVLEYNQNEIRFSNGSVYEIKIQEGTEDLFAIYKDSIKVCDNIRAKYINALNDENEKWVRTPIFDYDNINNEVSVALYFSNPNSEDSYNFYVQQVYAVGGGY